MKQGGIEVKTDRVLIFEPWAIGIYGVNLMLDGELLPSGTQFHVKSGETVRMGFVLGEMRGLLRGSVGFRTIYMIPKGIFPEDLRFRVIQPHGRVIDQVRPDPEIIWASDPNRIDPFGRIPLIEVKHFTTRPPRD